MHKPTVNFNHGLRSSSAPTFTSPLHFDAGNITTVLQRPEQTPKAWGQLLLLIWSRAVPILNCAD